MNGASDYKSKSPTILLGCSIYKYRYYFFKAFLEDNYSPPLEGWQR